MLHQFCLWNLKNDGNWGLVAVGVSRRLKPSWGAAARVLCSSSRRGEGMQTEADSQAVLVKQAMFTDASHLIASNPSRVLPVFFLQIFPLPSGLLVL